MPKRKPAKGVGPAQATITGQTVPVAAAYVGEQQAVHVTAGVIEVNVSDAISLGVTDTADVPISPAQRFFLKGALEKVFSSVLSNLEIGVEVLPDGTVRVVIRLKSQRDRL